MSHIHIVDRITSALHTTKAGLARELGIGRAAVNEWKGNNKGIPIIHCAALERLLKNTSDPLTRIHMRPHDWHLIWPELADKENNSSKVA